LSSISWPGGGSPAPTCSPIWPSCSRRCPTSRSGASRFPSLRSRCRRCSSTLSRNGSRKQMC
jgi:hypothetical protein